MKRQSATITANGEAEVWFGANFWSRGGGPRMWSEYDAGLVESELIAMRDLGMTITRSFMYWPDFMPTPHSLDTQALANFRHFLDLHENLGMGTIPTFLVGHMSGENWDPEWRQGRSLFGDVWFVARQAWYVREATAAFADHPAVRGWLLTNEVPIYADWKTRGVGTVNHEEVTSWAQILIDAIRAGGGRQPVSVGDGAWGVEVLGADSGFRVRELAPLVDFHGPHVYRMENDPVRQHLGAAFICELLDIEGRPVVMEEFGVSSDYVSGDNAAHYYRQVLHNTFLAGARGWLAWNNTDYDALFERAPYSHHPFEMHFGLTDAGGAAKPQALEMKQFADLMHRLGVEHLTRPDTDVALVIPAYLESLFPFTQPEDAASVFEVSRQAYVASREADLPIGVAREADGLPDDCALYLLPSAKQLTAPSWKRLHERVADGAIVYASVFHGEHGVQRGPWWPNLDQTFGVVKQSRYGLVEPVDEKTVTLRFVQAFGQIAEGEQLTFPVAGTPNSRAFLPVVAASADVVAVDGAGRPALLRNRVGRGEFVLCTYPLEHFAARTPDVNPEPTWRLYAALATEAGVTVHVRSDDPRVLVDRVDHADGRHFAWFVSQASQPLVIAPRYEGELRDLSGDVIEEIALDAFGVVVVEHVPVAR
ncbi:cellulase family glycosylhydrolase [Microbacterium invictum]|uniref:Cellulase family glycosylhydrolase n=2 Tax=Microbacterium invictum TaxID=515415 RepID=A0ABZ0VDC4_9MICO|nr:cellulase family glycosylhydrolase [Microbacterium invictum]WQB70681.1 cellulase family glycosylhydrolase [Microbacterium invictum]